MNPLDLRYMQAALEQARQAYDRGEVPVGAVVVYDGQIIARAHNAREMAKDPIAHAEMLALRRAAQELGGWRLHGASLYVTLEPCPMCAGAVINARLDRLIYGATDPKAGYAGTLHNTILDPRLNHRCELTGGVMQDECAQLLRTFFQQRRSEHREGGAV